MPAVVAAADVGVAPYDTARLRQLRLGFYWSPLKIFEYMASVLRTVTVPIAPLTEIVRDGCEAVFFREADAADLAACLVRLAEDGALRRRLGAAARARVVERYSCGRKGRAGGGLRKREVDHIGSAEASPSRRRIGAVREPDLPDGHDERRRRPRLT